MAASSSRACRITRRRPTCGWSRSFSAYEPFSNSFDTSRRNMHSDSVMKNIMTQKSLQWTPDELAFQRKTANYVAEFDFAPGTDWTFDEEQQEYHCTFATGRRKISVLISRHELLAYFGR